MGSTEDARRAGTMQAKAATASKSNDTPAMSRGLLELF
jgi:hypothetical protein